MVERRKKNESQVKIYLKSREKKHIKPCWLFFITKDKKEKEEEKKTLRTTFQIISTVYGKAKQ